MALPFWRRSAVNYLRKYWSLYAAVHSTSVFHHLSLHPHDLHSNCFKRYSIVQNVWDMPLGATMGWNTSSGFFQQGLLYAVCNTFMLTFDLDGFPAPPSLPYCSMNSPTNGLAQSVAYMPHFLS